MSTKYNTLDNQSNKVSRRYSINNVKINPFGILNDNNENNNDNDNNISISNNNINSSNTKLDELIRKYEAKNYLLPAQRKLVEEELARRNMKVNNTKNNNDNFPTLLSNTKSENIPIKFTEQTFKDIITNINTIKTIKKPEPILINVKPKSQNINIPETIKSVECLSDIPNTIDTEETKNSHLNLKLSNNKVNTQTEDFIKNMCNKRNQTYNERKLYKEYLHEKLYKEYAKPMSYDEWCEFKNDIVYQERIELQREKERYGILSSSDEDKFDDDYNIEDIEQYDNDCDYDYNNDDYRE